MVRYRLLILSSAPIVLTLLSLIAITVYWSIHYTWNSTLIDVSDRLGIANNSITLLQTKQAKDIESLADSYDFRVKLDKGFTSNETTLINTLSQWVSEQKERYKLDFLAFYPVGSKQFQEVNPLRILSANTESTYGTKGESHSLRHNQSVTSFDRLSVSELESYSQELKQRAEVPLVHDSGVQGDGLVSRTVLPIFDTKQILIGYLDGGILLNNSTVLVDKIKDLIYPITNHDSRRPVGTVTVFLDEYRVSTNVPLNSSGQNTDQPATRAIGTKVSKEVEKAVLIEGNQWVDRAFVYDAWYITAYQPIKDSNNDVIGMLYTGYLIWPFVKEYMTNIVEVSIMTILLLLGSGYVVYRGSRDLFQPIERIHKVVKHMQLGKDKRIGNLGLDEKHELAQLARQFDNMLDSLEQRKVEIEQSAAELELKVQKRTASLEEKTAQLEHHISLLNQTRDKLVTNEKLAALGELTAGIAHEINNPTAVILGNAELIKFELGDNSSQIKEELNAILEQVDRIRNITRSLLQYSRHGGIQDEITWERVNPIVEESVTLVKTGSKKKQVRFITDLKAKTAVAVNRHQFLQVLVNLQMNAIYAMEGEGDLKISTDDWYEGEELKGAVIHVEDQGCGISQEQIKRVFDPFYTTKRDGTGLGLSVSQSILSQSGGEIKVSSELGKGSLFSIYLLKKTEHIPSVCIV
ncbi:cache domain-containing protein [Vibrio sp. ZSDE26]|uniref:histidine kinase n=1 Tax=Vibrio amylolyticus TaxID=2847292 RepID=A0A9X1XMD6_9VIBR|nr:cache domain-containing protein [Vibrio amylolyticus]MCK6264975.1 cache domain-containing protein [Vibrio amylolyticus]